jgi:hypothetical protein
MSEASYAEPLGGLGQSRLGRVHGEAGLKEFSRAHSVARQLFFLPTVTPMTIRQTKSAFTAFKCIVHLLHRGQ